MIKHRLQAVVVALVVMTALPASAQQGYDPAGTMAAQREAMAPLRIMDGVWRGPAWTILPSGEKHSITQTERIGPFLDGTIRVIEGRGYEDSGRVTFNAFGIVSYNPTTRAFTLHTHAQGRSGDFALKLTGDGYVWETPGGPGTTIRYTATIKNGTWLEVGDRIVNGKEPVRFFEMNLKRVGNSDWPMAGTVPPK